MSQDSNTRYTKKLIPKETWRKAKSSAALQGITLAEWLTRAIEEKYKKGEQK